MIFNNGSTARAGVVGRDNDVILLSCDQIRKGVSGHFPDIDNSGVVPPRGCAVMQTVALDSLIG